MKQDTGSDVREMQRAWQQGRAPLGSRSTFIHSVGFQALETALGPHLAEETLSPTCSGGDILMRKVLPETLEGLCSDSQFTKERYEAHSKPGCVLGYVTIGTDPTGSIPVCRLDPCHVWLSMCPKHEG